MKIRHGKITIVHLRKPKADAQTNDRLQWFGKSLGMFGLRDKDKSCFRLFIELLKSARKGEGMSSDELAYRLRLTRGTVVHHLNSLMEAGIVMRHGKSYLLREGSLTTLMGEIKEDLVRVCDDLHDVAEKLDKELIQ